MLTNSVVVSELQPLSCGVQTDRQVAGRTDYTAVSLVNDVRADV